MNKKTLRIAEELVKTAEDLIFADDYEYIYDPDHKKNPGGGYIQTESGWSKGKKDDEEETSSPKDEANNEQKQLENKTNNKKEQINKKIEETVSKIPEEKIKEIAKDKEAPSPILEFLSKSKNPKIRELIAGNKSTPTGVLDKLSKDTDKYVRYSVAKNENTPVETLEKLSKDEDEEVKFGVSLNKNASSKALDNLSSEGNTITKQAVAGHSNTSAETLEKLSKDKNDEVRKAVALNENTSAETLGELCYDETVGKYVAYNENTDAETLEWLCDDVMTNYIGDSSDDYTLEAIANHKNSKLDTLDQIAQKFKEGTEIGDAARKNMKSKGAEPSPSSDKKPEPSSYSNKKPSTPAPQKDKLPKFKFKGDDKTDAIIRSKFEKGEDKEETDTIYAEMAKFSKEDVAPMGVYHGRTKEQLKADFIKKMNPANYSSPEAFKNAQERLKKMSAKDFSRVLASIFADEDEEI